MEKAKKGEIVGDYIVINSVNGKVFNIEKL